MLLAAGSTTLKRCSISGIFNFCSGCLSVQRSFSRFTGPVPPSLGAAPKLAVLTLHENALFGRVPDAEWPALTILSVHRNLLAGAVPPIHLRPGCQDISFFTSDEGYTCLSYADKCYPSNLLYLAVNYDRYENCPDLQPLSFSPDHWFIV